MEQSTWMKILVDMLIYSTSKQLPIGTSQKKIGKQQEEFRLKLVSKWISDKTKEMQKFSKHGTV